MFTRRLFCAAGAAAAQSACANSLRPAPPAEAKADWPPPPAFYGAVPDEPIPVPAVSKGMCRPFCGGLPPGPGNPPGARAPCLFQNGQDRLYRIHGACEPEVLGKAVPKGCIRFPVQDAIGIYDRAFHGAKVAGAVGIGRSGDGRPLLNVSLGIQRRVPLSPDLFAGVLPGHRDLALRGRDRRVSHPPDLPWDIWAERKVHQP